MDPRFKVIFKCITGSHLFGTSTPQSDLDVRGVFIPTEEFYLGFINRVEQVESREPDECLWEIMKFLKLCLEANPNIIELLFVPLNSKYVLEKSAEWDEIVRRRSIFLSAKVKATFSGYASSQLHRIKQHREWLLHPPTHKPMRQEFGLPETNVITKDQINAYDELAVRGKTIELSVPSLQVLHQEKAYFNAARYWDQYQQWKAERNKSRADLEARYGYDTKHAMHLVRLLSEGKELLLTGNITLPRPDARELLEIRNGKYTYDELMAMIGGDIDKYLEQVQSNIVLQPKPDAQAADELCIKLIKNRLGI
jgi:uncharacterized protein